MTTKRKASGKKSTKSISMDRKRRSSQPWERGKKAPRKGNPRYTPKMVRTKAGKLVKRYVVRRKTK